MTESRIEIPYRYANDEGVLVGILRRQDGSSVPSSSAQQQSPRPIALILHGVLAHKDQLYHRALAERLPLDSFRFDFRHAVQGGETRSSSKYVWHMSNFAEDVLDLHTVIKHLRTTYNYHVETLIAHSRGVLDAWTYFHDIEMRRSNVSSNEADQFVLDRIPFYVALSGRWDMQRMSERFAQHNFEKNGPFDWHIRVRGQKFCVQVTKAMVDEFCTFPIHEMTDKFPEVNDCLLIHGTKDATVPVEDSFAFKDKLDRGMRPPRMRSSSHELVVIQDADHTFKGHFDEVNQSICSWLEERRKQAQSGDSNASPSAIEFQRRCRLGGQDSNGNVNAGERKRLSSDSRL